MAWKELPLPEEVETLAARIRATAIAVHREVGPGFREGVYRRCLAHGLRLAGHEVEVHRPLTVAFRGLVVERAGEPDLIVDRRVVVELKARESIHVNHTAQLMSYVRNTGVPLGLLFNFHVPLLMKQGYQRVVHPEFLVQDP